MIVVRLKQKRLFTLMLCAAIPLAAAPAGCREQWQMNHPPGSPPSADVAALGGVRVPGSGFWQGQGASGNYVPAGTILTGILQDDISSNKSKSGEVFSILLPDGLQLNGRRVIPVNSKILGSIVSAMPAAGYRTQMGHPGQLEISLQTLILPNGQTIPFYGFIDHNINLDPGKEPKLRTAGFHFFGDLGSSYNAFNSQFTAGIGRALNVRHRGPEYSLSKGAGIPLRLTQGLELPGGASQPGGAAPSMQSMIPPPPEWQNRFESVFPNQTPGQSYGQFPVPQAGSTSGILAGPRAGPPAVARPELQAMRGTLPKPASHTVLVPPPPPYTPRLVPDAK